MKSPRLSIAHRPTLLFLILLVSSLLFVSPLPGRAATQQFTPGDVFAGLSTGDIAWYDNSGVSRGTLRTRLNSFVTGMAFNPLGCTGPKVPCLFATNFNANEVTTFDLNGNSTGKFGGPYNSAPESIVFDTSGNVYIGLADGDKNILKFDQQGNLLARFTVVVEKKGADWIDLGYEQDKCRILYTSEGTLVKQFDANANPPLMSNFAVLPRSDSRQVLIIPPTSTSYPGYVLVADDDQIVLLNTVGGVVTSYGSWGTFWFGLALDPDPNSFWGADFETNKVYKFTLGSTSVPLPDQHVISFPNLVGKSLSGLAVYLGPGGTSKGQGCKTSSSGGQGAGRMTGGGSVFASSGVRVTHGFELHCDPSQQPNSLEVNWDSGNKFHLEKLDSADCKLQASPKPPAAGFNTYIGSGTGRYNGVSGATATWTFTDAGEPGTKDTATITIKDSAGNTVLNVSGNLDKGNQQAHAN